MEQCFTSPLFLSPFCDEELEVLPEIVLGAFAGVLATTHDGRTMVGGWEPSGREFGCALERGLLWRLQEHFGPGVWRGGHEGTEKDFVRMDERGVPCGSFELKTTSTARETFMGCSSTRGGGAGRKSRDGFYLLISYYIPRFDGPGPRIRQIRYGVIHDADFSHSKSPNGNGAPLRISAFRRLEQLYLLE